MSEKVYEMLWDCRYCGAQKLLGKTHRHCPSCGAPQENAPRYFPPENEKVAVEDHVYVGADALCTACGASASRAAKHCGGCGAPLEGAKDVARQSDQLEGSPAGPVAPTAAPGKSMAPVLLGGAGCAVLLLLVITVLVVVFWRKEAGFEVVGHSWERSIEVERYQLVEETKWCDELPSGVSDVRRAKAERSKKKVQDGEDCKVRKIDQGDGTYKEKKECTPRYKQEPVYDEECKYKINRWKPDRTEKATGTELTPRWPDAKLAKTGECLGCEREGKRAESYAVHLRDAQSGEKHACNVAQTQWSTMQPKSRWKGAVRVVGGGVACGTLAPQ